MRVAEEVRIQLLRKGIDRGSGRRRGACMIEVGRFLEVRILMAPDSLQWCRVRRVSFVTFLEFKCCRQISFELHLQADCTWEWVSETPVFPKSVTQAPPKILRSLTIAAERFSNVHSRFPATRKIKQTSHLLLLQLAHPSNPPIRSGLEAQPATHTTCTSQTSIPIPQHASHANAPFKLSAERAHHVRHYRAFQPRASSRMQVYEVCNHLFGLAPLLSL